MKFVYKLIMQHQHHVTLSGIVKRVICILVILSLGHSIQINDVVLRNKSSSSQKQTSNSNVTRLKKTSTFDENSFHQIILRSTTTSRSVNKASSYKKASLFSPWSLWSECDRKCKQKRTRNCIKKRKCGSVKQTEERNCDEYLCQRKSNSNDNNSKNWHNKNKHNKKHNKNRHQQKIKLEDEDDPYVADDEYSEDDFDNSRAKRHFNDQNRIVMKVVKQGDYRHKQSSYNQRSSGGMGDIEQNFFLPRNLTLNSHLTLRNADIFFDDQDTQNYSDDSEDGDDDIDSDVNEDSKGAKTRAVFEVPRKPISNYSKWSRWSKCSQKCTTRRYKKCRPHAKHICGTDIIREIAYCYTEGSFCEEWISSQLNKINGIETTTKYVRATTAAATRPPRASRRTESPFSNTVYNNPYPQSGKRRNKTNIFDYKPHNNFQCGFPSIRNKNPDFTLKIIGGKVSRRGAWPWQVVILNRYKEAFCGGTLISPNWVLTASHCVRKRLYVILGEHNLNVKEGSEIEFKIQTAIKHPKYNKKTVDSDIALLKLPQRVERSNFIGFACLPEKSQQLPVGRTCVILGYGKKKHSDESGTSLLHEAEVPIVSNESCRNAYYDYVITKNMFCAGGLRRDTCSGDSGGPILCRDSKRSNKPWTVFGITSFGDGCGKKNKFGIYTKITNYVDFIWSIVNCNGMCENNNTY
ncbi:hypothetical protein PVAND_010484 [Polypedilum vanderplanki]|uniref:Peptidase S1 domain-containing protein n=1 Tax=Polypedilum vanderplanki TaxID=319348 RepID=A0A9J6CFS2_POLVA|nr:hypothetical protein PVAND_010484 [Polypedilum vanderplanki]